MVACFDRCTDTVSVEERTKAVLAIAVGRVISTAVVDYSPVTDVKGDGEGAAASFQKSQL